MLYYLFCSQQIEIHIPHHLICFLQHWLNTPLHIKYHCFEIGRELLMKRIIVNTNKILPLHLFACSSESEWFTGRGSFSSWFLSDEDTSTLDLVPLFLFLERSDLQATFESGDKLFRIWCFIAFRQWIISFCSIFVTRIVFCICLAAHMIFTKLANVIEMQVCIPLFLVIEYWFHFALS